MVLYPLLSSRSEAWAAEPADSFGEESRVQNYYLFWISHLVGKSSFKSRTEVFSFLCYRWNVQDKWPFCGFGRFGLCVFIFSAWYVITCHDTKENAGLIDFIPVSKTITKNKRIFSFLYIVFYWKNNLKLCFSLADTAVKSLLKY